MRSSWRERRACCGYLNQGRGLSPLPSGEDNDAQLFAQTRTLRIRQLNGFDLSIVESTSPLRAVASIPLTDFHGVSRARGPKRQLSKQPAFQFGHKAQSQFPGHQPLDQTFLTRHVNRELTIGAIAHRQCRLIWLILHQGVRYEERGPAVTQQSKQRRTARMIRQLRSLGYRIEPPNPQQPSPAQAT